jgi:N-acetylneuraminate lyase
MLRLTGLVAATFTPMREDGSLNLDQVGPVVDRLVADGVSGLYVCGSTGEGPLLSTAERYSMAAAFMEAASGRIPAVIHVGHSSVSEAQDLARHAQQIGADAISAVAPWYFKPSSVGNLVDCLAQITSAAPELPFYYYHIPALTGISIDPVALLREASDRLPTFNGIKYTAPTVDEFQELIEFDDGRFDVLFGRDEMLIYGLTAGAQGAIGSTYNLAAPLYVKLMAAFARGDLPEARRLQALAIAMIRVLLTHGHPAFKATMGLIDTDCGPERLPLVTLAPDQREKLRSELDAIGFFDFAR